MGDVLTFAPLPSVAAPAKPAPMTEAEIRNRLGEALQTALDAADHIIAVLDRIDDAADHEDGGDAEPALAAPENHRNRVTWLRNNDSGCEAEPLAVVLSSIATEQAVNPFAPLPWGGSGNVVAAAGVALLKMVAGGGR